MPVKIGIPRALLFYHHYPFWRTFFQELGMEIIVSPETNRRILEEGIRYSVDEVCLPVKVYHGHVAFLRDKVDFMFIPRIASVEKRFYVCAKFLGLPDVVRNSFLSLPPLLNVDIDLNRRSLYQSMYELGRILRKNPLSIHRAYRLAHAKQYQFTDNCSRINSPAEFKYLLEGRDLHVKVTKGDYHIALVGHSYNIYDSYVSLNLVGRLEKMGISVVTVEMVPTERIAEEARNLSDQVYWTYGKDLLGGAHYLARKRIDGIIFLISFGCGPDSLIAELAVRKLKNCVPVMSLIIDEQTGEAGVLTRLESFVEMIKRRKKDR